MKGRMRTEKQFDSAPCSTVPIIPGIESCLLFLIICACPEENRITWKCEGFEHHHSGNEGGILPFIHNDDDGHVVKGVWDG